ncbi:LLM class flavin-dependent oxidoreductase [Sciscionella marina]|uniref:LLM class flavin-dependent oxidoreductase n=1 Tax=Sciscionella marina TaxID=508770 RepID=UPI00037068F5|nr:LLM class flavin-dependent oxidoreductase [Sciscionella marina]
MAVKIGIWVPSYAWQPSTGEDQHRRVHRLKEYIQRCEQLGFDIWDIDHLLTAPGLYGNAWLEPLSVLTYASALTEQAMLGTGILVLPLRHPVLLAKEIATMAQLSNDRYIFGVGPGWDPKEFESVGTHISERGRRTDEIIAAVQELLSKESASFDGEFYSFHDVTIEPRPAELPQIWVSGGSRVPDPNFHDRDSMPTSVLNRIAKSDAWLSRCSGTQDRLLRDWRTVGDHLESLGKPRDSVRFAHCNFIQLSPGQTRERALEQQHEHAVRAFGTHRSYEHLQECYLLGDLDHQLGRLTELAEHGMDYVVLGPLTDDLEQLDMIAEHIRPALGD